MMFGRRFFLSIAIATLCACNGSPTTPTRQPIVVDPPPPPSLSVSCPANVATSAIEGTQVAVQFPVATSTGGVAPVQVSCTRQTGSMFPTGATEVQCTATDAANQSASCLFTVSVTALPPPPPQLTRTKFLAFGDSLTMGEVTVPNGARSYKLSVMPSLSYPTKLAELLKARYATQASSIDVGNAGWSGEWAQDGAKRFPQVLSSARAEVVILLEGINDIASTLQLGVHRGAGAVNEMAKEARNRGVRVIIATLPPSRPDGDHAVATPLLLEFNSLIRNIASGEGAILVDLYGGMAGDVYRYIGHDGLHPSPDGYQRMAELFSAAIRSNFEVK